MGLARELTMGSRRGRNNRIAAHPDFAALRRFTQAENPDLGNFRAILDRVGASPNRLRFKEGVIYIEACKRYRELAGEQYGPALGTY
ncbi:hypothetical protein [Streptomyces mobaraensis]|uniref:Uncharacterized protein n=1 Tax=Streptomyces mobaraensis TaxID=35621 RepID=A0A5N5WD87_STRMB|nr:hypothetical protein [Streptomyces mobaraensis]KAB7850134.1 hypothetical protein FRZ00_05905 [Streptomyces mobaraensis]